MDDLLSEKEQIEQMRAWWSEYGRYVIAGVVIAVGLLFGFNQYNQAKRDAQLEASALYEQLAEHISDGDAQAAEAVAAELAGEYANTTYAAQSKLAMARLYMDRNRDQDAADSLRELLALRDNDELEMIARLRLARILLYQDKPEEVIDLLDGQDTPAFSALYNEVLGDAYTALGRIDEAGAAYRAALAEQGQAPTIDRALVQMKLNDLPNPATAMAPRAEPPLPLPSTTPAGDGAADTSPAAGDEAGADGNAAGESGASGNTSDTGDAGDTEPEAQQ